MTTNHVLPFGKHKDQAIADVPTSYLSWLTTIKLSSGLKSAVVEVLQNRGVVVPQQPPAKPPVCSECEELGIELKSAGGAVHVGKGWEKLTVELRQKLAQCRHGLARLMGDQTAGAAR